MFGCSVLHAFRTKGDIRMCVINISNRDIRLDIKSLREKHKDNGNRFEDELSRMVTNDRKLYKVGNVLEDQLTRGFLKHRK